MDLQRRPDSLYASPAWQQRTELWSAAHPLFDVVIIGGGVQGACLFQTLACQGRRVLLVDRRDFGGGTSQASSMLVWGGLLYLQHLDVIQVLRLSAARDELIRGLPDDVTPHEFALLSGDKPEIAPWRVTAALWLYWLLSCGRRSCPCRGDAHSIGGFVGGRSARSCMTFQEGRLRLSDAQFVLSWIRRARGREAMAINYCELAGGGYDTGRRRWRLELRDTLGGPMASVEAKWVVNAAGVWADRVNGQFGVETAWHHVLAKGAAFTFPRPPDHCRTLIFDGQCARDGLSLVPWGPVSLWGSTETVVRSPDEGWNADEDDIGWLLERLNRHLVWPVAREQIIALRCGVRPLALPRGRAQGNPLVMSKRWHICSDPHRPWITIFGGKLTSCLSVSRQVARRLAEGLGKPVRVWQAQPAAPRPEMTSLAGIQVPTPSWCREHTMCWTLEDYLRRRTNLAQWVPFGGLGRDGVHRQELAVIARDLAPPNAAEQAIEAYGRRVDRERSVIVGAMSMEGALP